MSTIACGIIQRYGTKPLIPLLGRAASNILRLRALPPLSVFRPPTRAYFFAPFFLRLVQSFISFIFLRRSRCRPLQMRGVPFL